MPTEVLSMQETPSGYGDAGPLQVIKNKHCGNPVTVAFTDNYGGAALTLVSGAPVGAGEYGNNAWVIFGPSESVVTLSGPNAWTNPQTFTPDYPGRWLVRLTTTVFGGTPTVYTALVDIKDPQLSGVSIPAPNETVEFDPDEGWSRDAEEMHKTLSRTLGFREIVSVSVAGGSIAANVLVTPTNQWMKQWKSSPMSLANYNNFVIEVEAVNDASAKMLTQPVFLMLETVTAAPVNFSIGEVEKGLALLKGVLPYDTTGTGITNGPAGAGADLYALGAALPFDATAPAAGGADRKIAKVLVDNLTVTNPPGVIFFDGHFDLFLHQLYIGDKLTVDGLIDPTGLELTPVAANPGGVTANTLWQNSGAGDALMFGAAVVFTSATGSFTPAAIVADPAPALNGAHYSCSAGAFTVTLPAVATSTGFRILIVNMNAANAITVDGNAAETIIGLATYPLPNQYDSVTVWCDGVEWMVE